MGTNPMVSITADVTHWPSSLREELEQKIRELGVKALAGVTAIGAVEVGEVESTGWTYDAYLEAVKALLGKHFVQAQAISEAVKAGTGKVSRETVYELGGYDEGRSLKGFTRPVNRIQADLVDRGVLPEDADDLLTPVYPPGARGYSRATGFKVPMEVVKIALEARVNSGGDK